jgi:hypothetical protein
MLALALVFAKPRNLEVFSASLTNGFLAEDLNLAAPA